MSQPSPINPYQAPESENILASSEFVVPESFLGKFFMGVRLLLGNLHVIAPVVLTVWLPAHVAISTLVEVNDDINNTFAAMRLDSVVEAFFGPLISGAVIWALADRMEGRKPSYFSAMGGGLASWARLFGARFVAGWIILIGMLALIVPGILLAVRYALIDEAVVLEGAGVSDSRRRSEDLVRGKGWEICLTWTTFAFLLIGVGLVGGISVEEVPILNTFWGNIVVDSAMSVFSALISCVLFLYYWESRTRELRMSEASSVSREGMQSIDWMTRGGNQDDPSSPGS